MNRSRLHGPGRRPRAVAVALFTALVVLTVTACGDGGGASGPTADPSEAKFASDPNDPREQAMEQLYEDAKAEGQLVFTTSDASGPDLAEAFTERFPGIEVQHISRTGGVTSEHLVTETAGGKQPSVDVAYTTFSTIGPLIDHDLIDTSVDWAALGFPKDYVFLDGRMVLWYDQVQVISYNTTQVQGDLVPETWEDVLDERFHGAVAVDPRGHGVGPYAFLVGEEQARSVAEQLVALEPVYAETAGSRMAQAVASGQAMVGFADHLDKVLSLQAQGAPIDWVPVNPVPAQEFGWALVKGAAHPAAAKLWMVWTSTAEGQKRLGESNFNGAATEGSPSVLRQEIDAAGLEVVREHDYEAFLQNVEFRTEMAALFGVQ